MTLAHDWLPLLPQIRKRPTKQQRQLETWSLCVEIHRLLRVMWSGRWGVLTPNSLVVAVWRFMPAFRGYQQQDAMEFFQSLADSMHEELRVRRRCCRLSRVSFSWVLSSACWRRRCCCC